MSEQTITDDRTEEGFTAQTFAAFWAAPAMSEEAIDPIAEDVVGYWPGEDEPVRGREAYIDALVELLRLVPDLTLSVAESARDGENLFIRWIARAADAEGRQIEQTGVDRIRVVDGRVVENRIFFDRAQFERKLGRSLAV